LMMVEEIPCSEHSLATRFSPTVNPIAWINYSAMSRYPNSGSSACTSIAALIRCASSQSRWDIGLLRQA
jgi:hypothetical protein